jgi:heat shock protein HslJ
MKSFHSTQFYRFVALLMTATFLLAACQAAAPSTSVPLQETNWLMQSFRDSQGQTVQAQPGSEATAIFSKDSRLTGNATCNRYTAEYTVDGDRITIKPGAMTLMACGSDLLNAQEQGFVIALGSAASYKIQGEQLNLMDKDGNIVLTFNVQQPTSLVGTNWQALSYNNGNQAVVSLLAGSEISAVFSEDGKLSGKAGCNNYTTSYKVDGTTIQIEPAATTRMMCSEPQGVMEQEAAYLKALEAAKTYAIEGKNLILFGQGGERLVEYSAK